MKRLPVLSLVPVVLLFILPVVSSSQVWAQATLENPRSGSSQSGVAAISGWACGADEILIELNGVPYRAGYPTTRPDTLGRCGDTDNGFSLLWNWNNLGAGTHTVRALIDGVEFANTTVHVTTFGADPFPRGWSGTFDLPNFPASGETAVVQWEESLQNFVITDEQPNTGGGYNRVAGIEAILENPSLGSAQSGVGVISGWACEAEAIVIELNGEPYRAGYPTTRPDTLGRCGDTDNGFSLLWNWNNLGAGTHTVRALIDGQEFANTTVRVTTFGEDPFPRGLSGTFPIPDFPRPGETKSLRWEESLQNFVITQTTSTPVSAHFIPDTNLRRAIVNALGKSPGATITKAELATLRGLDASDYGIVDLTGLEFATNLTDLWLSRNKIEDLTPLASLTDLIGLSLWSNKIATLAPLAGLTDLRSLSLWSNEIEDLAPLASLTDLTYLDLDGNDITDITPLAGLTNLTTLHLSRNKIEDLIPLASLTDLTGLSLDFNNEIEDLAPLASLTNLETLTTRYTFVTDLAPLFSLTKLTSLNIDGAPVRQADLATLIEAGVAIDGTPFSAALLAAAVDIHHDNVIVLHLPELPATLEAVDLTSYARRIYMEFEDAFDHLMFVSNLDKRSRRFSTNFYRSVRNDIQGIGGGIFSSSRYGSPEQLLGVIYLTDRVSIKYGPSLHELVHTWANDVVPTSVRGHWGFSSANGQLGGFALHNLVHLGGNRYTVHNDAVAPYGWARNHLPYSPIELYLAGLIPPDEVPDLWVAEDGEWLIENGAYVLSDEGWRIFTATKVRTITINDIIAEHGERVPDWTTSQKDFQAAAVLLVDDDHPATPEHIQEVSDHVAWFSYPGNDDDSGLYNFYEATSGRAFITMDGLSEFLLPD